MRAQQFPAGSSPIVVGGGGIAGLAAAYRLQTAADVEPILVEAEPRLGGKILTERVDGFLVEGGPDSFLASKPRALELCRELEIADQLVGTNEATRRTYVLWQGRLYEMPEGLTGLIPSRLEPMLASDLFSAEGKNRLAQEPDIAPRLPDGDESLASFVERRFGREVYDRLVEPVMAGIYAGDGERLSLAATFPQLRELELEHGSLLKAMQVSSSRAEPQPAGLRGFLTPRRGMAEIVTALARRLRSTRVSTGTPAAALKESGAGYTVRLTGGEEISARAVILATPAFAAAELLWPIDGELAETLGEIEYVSTATVSLAFRLEDVPSPLDGHGYVVPRVEDRPILACSWTSNKFPDRAPLDSVLLRLFIGRKGQESVLDRPDDELVAIAMAELDDVFRVQAKPVFRRVYRWPQAMPQYELGHLDRLAKVQTLLRDHPGIFLAGNAYRGIGIPDCIQSGEAAAESALASLRHRPSRVVRAD